MLGSFLNVVAIRTLKKESIVFPPSHCPSCSTPLRLYDLIPVLSYIYLRGKCRYCQQPISVLYPLGELLTAVLFFMIYKTIGISYELIPAYLLALLLILSVLTDLRQMLILDRITIPFTILLGVSRLFIGEYSFFYYVGGGIAGFLLLLAVAFVSKGGMGGGDVKLYGAIGLVLGPSFTILSFIFATMAGAIGGLLLLASGKVKRKEPIAFGPYILIGTFTAYLFGHDLLAWYAQFW